MRWIPAPAPDGALAMWTVYDHPKDYADGFIARLWLVRMGEPEPFATDQVFTCSDLEVIRDGFRRAGLVCLARNESDDPCIMETWL